MTHVKNIAPLSYIPSFDGVRGIFCLIIIFHHLPLQYVRISFSAVWILLQAFFVMSGYLITRILLTEKDAANVGVYLKNFYAKRAFRIFPLYYTYILFWIIIVLLFGDNKFLNTPNINIAPDIKQNWWMLLTYSYNFKELFYFTNGQSFFEAPIFSHLWSLGVEEHFYLFFPFAVYFLSEKNLKKFVITTIIGVFFLRIIFYHYLCSINENPLWVGISLYRNTITQIDSLFIGALMALIDWDKIKNPKYWFLASVILFTAITIGNGYWVSIQEDVTISEALHEFVILTKNYSFAILMPLANIMSALFMLTLLKQPSWLNTIFEQKWAIAIGKISYGIYIYHFFVFLIVIIFSSVIVKRYHLDINSIWVNVCIAIACVSTTVLVAQLSFTYYESYFLKFKKYFQTPKSKVDLI